MTDLTSPALYSLGHNIEGIHVWEAVLELKQENLGARAAAWDNIGIFWRQLDHPVKIIEAMNKAIPLYRELGDKSRELIAERNTGEALVKAGRTEEGFARFRRAQSRVEEPASRDERWRIWANLAE